MARIVIRGKHRTLFNAEVETTATYIPDRPDYATHQGDADAAVEQVRARPEGDLEMPINGALGITANGCILVEGSEIHGACERGTKAENRSAIRERLAALEFWLMLAERVETEAGVAV